MIENQGFYGKVTRDLSHQEKDATQNSAYRLLLASNAITRDQEGRYSMQPLQLAALGRDFSATKIAFSGPGGEPEFFTSNAPSVDTYIRTLGQKSIIETIARIKKKDIDQAARISFLLGGVVRHFCGTMSSDDIAQRVKYEADMIALGEPKSYEAIATASAMLLMSDTKIPQSSWFPEDVQSMSHAIAIDPIVPRATMDLGLSQATRLQIYFRSRTEEAPEPSNIEQYRDSVKDLPTVGAEFHLSEHTLQSGFWERVALLNMSQYQRDSSIQFSRTDRDVIEIRMNPSVAPVAVADYNHMTLLVPEIRNAYFTTTLNKDSDYFSWKDPETNTLLKNIHALGLLGYASFFENVPSSANAEIPLGEIYLGQTVKCQDGEYSFTGYWNGGQGEKGQIGVYSGHGSTFPFFSYYLSMALANPRVFEKIGDISGIDTMEKAFSVSPDSRKWTFQQISNFVMEDATLRKAHEAGTKIVDVLKY